MTSSAVVSVFVVGTRAQLIKVAPVIVACEEAGQPVLLLLTGQHKETMQDLVVEFGIRCRQQDVVTVSERSTVWSLLGWAPRAYLALSRQLKQLRNQARTINVVVHGDTLSTVIGALAAKRRGVPLFHLESGLTSGRLFDPFPEELSRRIVFRLASVAICPSADSAQYMAANHSCQAVNSKENTIVDAVMIATTQSRRKEPAAASSQPYLVVSLHRFQNLFDGKRLRYLMTLLAELAARYPIHFVLHPATRRRLQSEGLLESLSRVPGLLLSPRLGYSDFLNLAAHAACVLTDGGSNQEELAVLGVPTIVMRQYTERPDGLGQNAVMEADVGPDFLAYCMAGRFESLRRTSRVRADMGPSRLVARLLSGAEG